MTVTVSVWKDIMEWKEHIEWLKAQSKLPWILRSTAYTRVAHWGGVTFYVPPIERTINNMVILNGEEEQLYKDWQIHITRARNRINKIKEEHRKLKDLL